jgi:hypothetical protein
MAWDYTNDYSSTILAYTSGAGTITVVSVTGLPASGRYFILKVDNEYFLCTSYTGLVLTVTGGQASSTPANHSLGAAITGCWIVPSVLDGIRSDQSQIGTYANLPTSGMKLGDRYKCTNLVSELIYDGSIWQEFYKGFYVNPLPSFSWRNQGTASIVQTLGTEFLLAEAAGSNNLKGREISLPSTPYTITITIERQGYNVGYANNGIYITDGTKCVAFGIGNNGNPTIHIDNYTDSTTYNGNVIGIPFDVPHSPIVLRVNDNGTNHIFSWSLDRVNFFVVATQSRTAFISTPTAVGYFVESNNATYPNATKLISWIQS